MRAHFRHHLRAEIGPAVEHGHDDAGNLDVRIRSRGAHLFDHADDFDQAFQSIILTLDRRQDFIGRGQCVGHENPERRRTIDQDKVESSVGPQDRQGLSEPGQMIFHAGDFDFSASQIKIGWDEEQPFQTRREDFLHDRFVAHQRIVKTLPFQFLHAEGTGGVALRVEIDQKNALSLRGQGGAQIDRGRGLTDASLLIGDGNDSHERGTMSVLNSKVWRPSGSRQRR